MVEARDLGVVHPAPVADLAWPAEDAASLGLAAVTM
jgi:hypothetical protein